MQKTCKWSALGFRCDWRGKISTLLVQPRCNISDTGANGKMLSKRSSTGISAREDILARRSRVQDGANLPERDNLVVIM